ncbi:uncharacterized protein LOC130789018 [Actinidia eriantha]|uniref:uncharacterized protein LOC130789018 n=1 Tax=Actinidia eriantha TaxID=165200 RepID=UPI00258DC4EB|nr:uncharacterized protein LOC130789018 [Actinidia eriantha]
MRFNLGIHCTCDGCRKKVKGLSIQGVDSIAIDKNQGIATISGTVDPHTVMKKLDKVNKRTVLLPEQIQPVPPKKQVQESCPKKHRAAKGNAPITVTLDPHTLTKELEKENKTPRKEAPQPVIVFKGLDESTRKRTPNCCHNLELKPKNKLFTCNGCKEEGIGPRYRCDPCDYDFHKECKSPKETTTHQLFKGSTFKYLSKPGINIRICDACGCEIKGCSYHCEAKNLDMHPCCSNLKGKLCNEGTDFILRNEVKYRCLWCNKKKPDGIGKTRVPGWSYVSKEKRICCHVHCMWPMVFEVWKKGGFHSTNDDDDTLIDDDNLTMALQKIDLKVMANSNGNGGGRRVEILKSIGIFLRAIIGILFGDPTVVLTSLLVELISK